MDFKIQLLPLLGVVVGAAMAFLGNGAIERARWKRQHSIRWDERRLEAYATYAAAVKRNSTAAAQQLALTGAVKTIRAADAHAGLDDLAAAEADRSMAFEGVLILGDTATIEAGSLLNREVYRMQALARGELPVDSGTWRDAFASYRQARLVFYRAARASMGIAAAAIPASSAWLEAAAQESALPPPTTPWRPGNQ